MTLPATVVITGASRGIGLAALTRFLAEGACVIGTSREEAGLDRIADAADGLPGRVHPVQLDVRSDDSVRVFAGQVTRISPHVDVLVCNAGVMIDADTVPEQTVAGWNAVLDVNLTGPFRVIQSLWPALGLRGLSSVITVSGGLGNVAGGMDGGGCVAYRVSKCGLAALTMTVAQEGADAGILACGYDPEWVRTDLGGEDAPKQPDACGVELVELAGRMARDKLTGALTRAGEVVPW
jgi:NAD(P)-dependent dehydrogenase (short-subunit alcohol dehydrogenase family)